MRVRNENANKCAIDFYTVSVRWKHADRTLTERSEVATNTQRARREIDTFRVHQRQRTVDVLSAYAYRAAERSHCVWIAYSLRTGRTSAYAENFCACIKFLGVRSELQRTSAYDTVLWTLAQPLPTCCRRASACDNEWQKVVMRRHTQSFYTL